MGHPLAWLKKTYFFPIGTAHPRHLSYSTVLAPEYAADVYFLDVEALGVSCTPHRRILELVCNLNSLPSSLIHAMDSRL